jgi:hypothetical protein
MGSYQLLIYASQWAALVAALYLGGLSWPRMFSREDEAKYVKDNFLMNRKDADGDPSRGMEEAWARFKDFSRFPHNQKNWGHSWFQENPKGAYKTTGFIICVLTTIILILIGVILWLL